MTNLRRLALAAALLGLASLAPLARGAGSEREPSLGYAYPAGGRQGTTVRVTVGGRNLRGAIAAHVTGRGVRASVVGQAGPGALLKPEALRAIGDRLRGLSRAALARGKRREAAPPPGRPEGDAPIPDHPFLRGLEEMSVRELRKVREFFFDPTRREQASPLVAESVELELAIDAGAPPGERELRVETREGLSNPILLEVGTLPETSEEEVNDFEAMPLPDDGGPLVVNGQVLAHDIDRFRLRVRRGERLVVALAARRLVPYIADAVPGWFQGALTLRDARGRELAYAGDHGLDPDPVLVHTAAADGEVELEVRDALYRGRSDFVYRVTVRGSPPARRPLAPRLEAHGLPEVKEEDLARGAGPAGTLSLPCVVRGRIGRPGEVDALRFEGRAGDEVVAEVTARRLGSPLDSWLELRGPGGRVIAGNDDHEDGAAGLLTHHADSYLRARLPGDGVYELRLADIQGHGGSEHVYRLRVGAPRPDFTLLVTPASLSVPAGSSAVVTAHVVRRDGFAGDVEVSVAGAARGFSVEGGVVPAGRDSIRMTLRAPRGPGRGAGPLPLAIAGRARIAGRAVTRTAIPAEEMTQAFLYRHLVPAQEMLVSVAPARRGAPPLDVEGEGTPVRLPRGGAARVYIRSPRPAPLEGLRLDLVSPPPGVTLGPVRATDGGITLELRADATAAPAGLRDNLIVEVHAEIEAGPRGGKGAKAGKPGEAERAGAPARLTLARGRDTIDRAGGGHGPASDMTGIADRFTDHHRHCDDSFAAAEERAAAGRWEEARAAFDAFDADMALHFSSEEETLFPAFEARTGMRGGPTAVMRMEHEQMRRLIAEMRAALAARDAGAFAGAAETLLVLMQQHNLKEESILYPMCERALGGDGALVGRITAGLGPAT
jgi:hypothetical protein